jgi:hypothetical protein
MSRPSPVTLKMAEQFSAIRAASVTIGNQGPMARAVSAILVASLIAIDLHQDKAAAAEDPRHEVTFKEFRQQAITEILPRLERHFLTTLAIRKNASVEPPAGTATPLELARSLQALGRLAEQPYSAQRIGTKLVTRIEDYDRQTREHLQSPEPADLQLLAANQRLIDEMLESLDLLGDADSAALIRQHSRILARASLARVTGTLENFLKAGDLDTRFDMATVLANVDDLLVIARRVIEGVGAEYDPVAEHYAEDLGMGALRRFAAAMLEIEQQTLRNCLVAVEKVQVSPEVFAASLLMLVKLHGLGRSILEGTAKTAATHATRAVERAEQLLRPKAMVQGVEYMTQQMARLLAGRMQDASDHAHRLDAYAAAFENFREQTGLGTT